MAKVTNFLSIALLVSVFAVVPAFGMEAGAAAAPAAPAAAAPAAAAGEAAAPEAAAAPAAAVAPAAAAAAPAAQSFSEKVASKTNWALDNVVDWANPFAYGADVQANHATKVRLVKYATVIALVASNPAVQGAFNSLVSTIQSALGTAEDEADEATTEPTRLVIGAR